jgi:hypothetical protein
MHSNPVLGQSLRDVRVTFVYLSVCTGLENGLITDIASCQLRAQNRTGTSMGFHRQALQP